MFRYPDKPASEISRAALATLPAGYMAQLKVDGWRCVIEFHADQVTFTTRHNKPCPVSERVANLVALMLDWLVPTGTILDAEWCSRRPGDRTESLTVFDVMKIGDEPLWHLGTLDRFDRLLQIVPTEWVVDYWHVPDCMPEPYAQFFDTMQLTHPEAEGIVLKRLDSKYIGSPRECAKNPGWTKCKWRAGEDGCTLLENQRATNQ